jgi:hypothetical protein
MNTKFLTISRLICFLATFIVSFFLKERNFIVLFAGATIAHSVTSIYFSKRYILGLGKSRHSTLKKIILLTFALLLIKSNFIVSIILLALHVAMSEAYINFHSRSEKALFSRNVILVLFHFTNFLFIMRSGLNPAWSSVILPIVIPIGFAMILILYFPNQNITSDLLLLIATVLSIFYTNTFYLVIFYHIFTWFFYPKLIPEVIKMTFHKNDFINIGLTAVIVLGIFKMNQLGLLTLEQIGYFPLPIFIIHAVMSFILSDLNPVLFRKIIDV